MTNPSGMKAKIQRNLTITAICPEKLKEQLWDIPYFLRIASVLNRRQASNKIVGLQRRALNLSLV